MRLYCSKQAADAEEHLQAIKIFASQTLHGSATICELQRPPTAPISESTVGQLCHCDHCRVGIMCQGHQDPLGPPPQWWGLTPRACLAHDSQAMQVLLLLLVGSNGKHVNLSLLFFAFRTPQQLPHSHLNSLGVIGLARQGTHNWT